MDAAVVPVGRAGFSLVEFMVVVVIVALTTVLGAPAFGRLLESTRIRTEATRLMSDIVLSRSESIKRNRQVIMCPAAVDAGGNTACAGLFANGWIVFVDSNRDGKPGLAETVIGSGAGIARGLEVTNRQATRRAGEKIIFSPDGSSRRNRTLMVCSRAQPGIESWSVVMNIVGRPRLARGWGQCPVPTG